VKGGEFTFRKNQLKLCFVEQRGQILDGSDKEGLLLMSPYLRDYWTAIFGHLRALFRLQNLDVPHWVRLQFCRRKTSQICSKYATPTSPLNMNSLVKSKNRVFPDGRQWHKFGIANVWIALRERSTKERSMNAFSILPIVCLASALLVTRIGVSAEAPELAELFCQAEISAQTQGRPLAENDEDWRALSKTLLERRLIPSVAENAPKSRVTECITKYRSDFEEGEFILRGLELLDLTAQREQQGAIAEVSKAEENLNAKLKDERLLSDLNKNVLAGLVPENRLMEASSSSNGESSSDQRAVQQALRLRRESYLKLWGDFTRKLRDKIFHTTIARSTDSSRRTE
jgi:hypothetical protein